GVRYSGTGVTIAPLHYFYRQLIWILIALPVMMGVSMMPRKAVRRMCLAGTFIFIGLLILVPVIVQEVNGAKRWIGVGFGQFQPSELLKTIFVVSVACLASDPRPAPISSACRNHIPITSFR